MTLVSPIITDMIFLKPINKNLQMMMGGKHKIILVLRIKIKRYKKTKMIKKYKIIYIQKITNKLN